MKVQWTNIWRKKPPEGAYCVFWVDLRPIGCPGSHMVGWWRGNGFDAMGESLVTSATHWAEVQPPRGMR